MPTVCIISPINARFSVGFFAPGGSGFEVMAGSLSVRIELFMAGDFHGGFDAGSQRHDVFLSNVAAAQFTGDTALVHDVNPIAHPDYLRQFAGDYQDRHPRCAIWLMMR